LISRGYKRAVGLLKAHCLHLRKSPGVLVRRGGEPFASPDASTCQTSNYLFTPEVEKRLEMNGVKGSGVRDSGTCLEKVWKTLGFNAKQNMAAGSKALLPVL
jgi:hypothetical protein